MYEISELKIDPRRIQFSWGRGTTFVYTHATNNKYRELKIVDYFQEVFNSKILSLEFMKRASQHISDYLNGYSHNLANYPHIKQYQTQKLKQGEKPKIEISMRDLLLGLKIALIQQINRTKNQLLQAIYLAILYFLEMDTEQNEISYKKTYVQKIFSWTTYCKSFLRQKKIGIHLHQISKLFIEAKYEDMIFLLNDLKNEVQSQRKKQIELLLQLLSNKFKFFQHEGTLHFTKQEFIKVHRSFIKKTRRMVQKTFPKGDYSDHIYLMCLALSGDHKAITQLAEGDWMSYVLLYVVNRNPLLNQGQIYNKITVFLARNCKQISERQLFLVYLTMDNYHPAYQFSLNLFPQQICGTLGMIAWHLRKLPLDDIIEEFDGSYYHFILKNMIDWWLQVPWEIGFIYFNEFILESQRLKINIDGLVEMLIYSKIEFQPIQSIEHSNRIINYYNSLIKLNLQNICLDHMKCMINYQIRVECFDHIFQLFKIYSKRQPIKEGDLKKQPILDNILKACYSKAVQQGFNYDSLVEAVIKFSKQLNSKKQKQILHKFDGFIKLTGIKQQKSIEKKIYLFYNLLDSDSFLYLIPEILRLGYQLINLATDQIKKSLVSKIRYDLLRVQFDKSEIYSRFVTQIQKFESIIAC